MRKEFQSIEEKTRGVIREKKNITEGHKKHATTMDELDIYVGEKAYKIFMTYGFYYHRNDFSTYHSHSSYHEALVIVGDCEMVVGNEILKLKGSNMMMIPPKVYHKMLTTENVDVCTFFIDTDIGFKVMALSEQIALSFLEESERAYKTKDYSMVAPYISLIISYLLSGEKKLEAKPVNDYAFLIDSYFNLHYTEDISLEALANYLHVSLTHAHRLVQKHTGVSFTEELTVRRLKVADFLVKSRGMSLTEAATAVGFRSYTGYWRARLKYPQTN